MSDPIFDYTIHYFPIRGLAELPRLIMEVGGISYKNTYPTDWSKEKSHTTFGQIPILIEKQVNPRDKTTQIGQEFTLPQSGAISRYLSRKVGLAGSSEHETAMIESIYESLVDIRTHWLKAYYAADVDKAKAMNTFFQENFVNWSSFFERFLDKHSGDFILGDKMNYADLLLFILCDGWLEYRHDILHARPYMKKVYTSVKDHPKVVEYIKSDRRHKPTLQR